MSGSGSGTGNGAWQAHVTSGFVAAVVVIVVAGGSWCCYWFSTFYINKQGNHNKGFSQ